MKDFIDRIAFEIETTAERSSGKGGQNVNKTSSKARIRWNVDQNQTFSHEFKERLRKIAYSYITESGDLILTCQESRDFRQNATTCFRKLNDLLFEASKIPRKRIATKPTRSSQRKRIQTKKLQGDKKSSRKKVDY